MQALEATGEINGKLIWSNTGYLINWYLTEEMKQLLGEATVESLCAASLFEKRLLPVEDESLSGVPWCYATACWCAARCQRYRLPDVQQCDDCTLK